MFLLTDQWKSILGKQKHKKKNPKKPNNETTDRCQYKSDLARKSCWRHLDGFCNHDNLPGVVVGSVLDTRYSVGATKMM